MTIYQGGKEYSSFVLLVLALGVVTMLWNPDVVNESGTCGKRMSPVMRERMTDRLLPSWQQNMTTAIIWREEKRQERRKEERWREERGDR